MWVIYKASQLFWFADKIVNDWTGRKSTLKNVKYYVDGGSGWIGNFECQGIYFGCILYCFLNMPNYKNSKDTGKNQLS